MKNSLPHKEITIDSLTKASRNKTEVWKSLVLLSSNGKKVGLMLGLDQQSCVIWCTCFRGLHMNHFEVCC